MAARAWPAALPAWQLVLGAGVGMSFQRWAAALGHERDIHLAHGCLAAGIVAAVLASQWHHRQPSAPQHALSQVQNDDASVLALAESLALQKNAEGEALDWPDGVLPEYAQRKADFPRAIWAEAERTWQRMNAAQRDEFRRLRGQLIEQNHGGGGQAEAALPWTALLLAAASLLLAFLPAARLLVLNAPEG